MATLRIEFTVSCSCGQELAASSDKWEQDLIVEPCERCLAEAAEIERAKVETEAGSGILRSRGRIIT